MGIPYDAVAVRWMLPRPCPTTAVGRLRPSGHRIQRTRRIARSLELLQGLPAHRRIDVQVRHTDDRTQFLEHEEADAVVNHPAPVEAVDEVALFGRQPGLVERGTRVGPEGSPCRRMNQAVEELVQAVRLDAARPRRVVLFVLVQREPDRGRVRAGDCADDACHETRTRRCKRTATPNHPEPRVAHARLPPATESFAVAAEFHARVRLHGIDRSLERSDDRWRIDRRSSMEPPLHGVPHTWSAVAFSSVRSCGLPPTPLRPGITFSLTAGTTA